MSDDNELLQRYAEHRANDAFAELVRRHLGLVYHTALRRLNGDSALAQEVAQAVFTALANNATELCGHQWLGGWLYVATRHAAANTQRGENRRLAREQEAMRMWEAGNTLGISVVWSQLRPELDAVLDELSDAERELVLARYFEDQPYASIAARLRISEDAARMRTHRALDRIRVLLARRGVTSTAAAVTGALATQSALAAPPGLGGAITAGAMASAGATSAGVLTLMATNKMMLVAAGAVALMAGGVATYQLKVARRLEGAVAQLQAEKGGWESQLRGAERAARASSDDARDARGRLAELERRNTEQAKAKSARTESAPSVTTKSASRQAMFASRQACYANPEYLKLQLKIAELGLGLQYGAMYRRLGWSQEKIAEFERLQLKQQHDLFTVMGAATLAGTTMDDPAVQTSFSDPSFQETHAKLEALFGRDLPVYKEYSEVNRAMARSTVTNLAGNLYTAGEPLTMAQAESLSRLIGSKTPRETVKTSGMVTAAPTDWGAVYTDAAAFLSPDQVSALRAVTERNELFQQANLLEQQIVAQRVAGSTRE